MDNKFKINTINLTNILLLIIICMLCFQAYQINLISQEIDSLWLIQSDIDDVSDDLRYIQRELSDIQSYLISL
jgi:hypothetical protein